jgi:hypothetical protein
VTASTRLVGQIRNLLNHTGYIVLTMNHKYWNYLGLKCEPGKKEVSTVACDSGHFCR